MKQIIYVLVTLLWCNYVIADDINIVTKYNIECQRIGDIRILDSPTIITISSISTTPHDDELTVAIAVIMDNELSQSTLANLVSNTIPKIVTDVVGTTSTLHPNVVVIVIDTILTNVEAASIIQSKILDNTTNKVIPLVAILTTNWASCEYVLAASTYRMIVQQSTKLTSIQQDCISSQPLSSQSSCITSQIPILYTDWSSAQRLQTWSLNTFITAHWTETLAGVAQPFNFRALTSINAIKITSQLSSTTLNIGKIMALTLPTDCNIKQSQYNTHGSNIQDMLYTLNLYSGKLVNDGSFRDTIEAAKWLICSDVNTINNVINRPHVFTQLNHNEVTHISKIKDLITKTIILLSNMSHASTSALSTVIKDEPSFLIMFYVVLFLMSMFIVILLSITLLFVIFTLYNHDKSQISQQKQEQDVSQQLIQTNVKTFGQREDMRPKQPNKIIHEINNF